MVATKKPGKRGAGKKRAAVKPQSAKKKKKGKAAAPKATKLRRRARKGLKAARGGLDTVLQAGEKTWKKLKRRTRNLLATRQGGR